MDHGLPSLVSNRPHLLNIPIWSQNITDRQQKEGGKRIQVTEEGGSPQEFFLKL
jgi:hypothetical protein